MRCSYKARQHLASLAIWAEFSHAISSNAVYTNVMKQLQAAKACHHHCLTNKRESVCHLVV